jgi:hypothetical protein
VRVLERIPLEGRRALYLVELGDRVLLIGAGEGGAPALLTEIDAADLPPLPERPPALADLLMRFRGEQKK